jgi:hypothetical protein
MPKNSFRKNSGTITQSEMDVDWLERQAVLLAELQTLMTDCPMDEKIR